MSDKIQEITQKIYNEGIVKAKADAEQIIADAKTEAEQIIRSAHRERESILSEAQKSADELKHKTDIEIQLAARQFISTVKQKITTLITASQVDKPVEHALNDVDFVKTIIQILINNWNRGTSEELKLNVLLPAKNEKEFAAFFDSRITESLNKEIELSFDEKMETGFKIGPQDGSYIISFTDDDFKNYFKRYIKDRTRKLLFEPVKQE